MASLGSTSGSSSTESGSPFRTLAATPRPDDPAVGAIQALKPEPRMKRYKLNDFEWIAIKPTLPKTPRGVRRVATRYGKLAASI